MPALTAKQVNLHLKAVPNWSKPAKTILRTFTFKNKETVVEGIDHAVDAFLGLFSGKNSGKMVVKLT
jgi:NADPH-dependent curcumin reductase CurA